MFGACGRVAGKPSPKAARSEPPRSRLRVLAPLFACLIALLEVMLPGIVLLGRDAGASAADRVKSGTGFFVSGDGFLLTSAHVVSGCPRVSVWAADRTAHPAYLIAVERRHDIALLWAGGGVSSHPAATLLLPPRQGEPVLTIGYGVLTSQPLRPVLVHGTVLGSAVADSGSRVLMIRARLQAGTSGGPVLAADGSLLGMVIGRDEADPDLGVAIPNEDIEALLSRYGLALGRREPSAQARDLLPAISVLVQCAS